MVLIKIYSEAACTEKQGAQIGYQGQDVHPVVLEHEERHDGGLQLEKPLQGAQGERPPIPLGRRHLLYIGPSKNHDFLKRGSRSEYSGLILSFYNDTKGLNSTPEALSL